MELSIKDKALIRCRLDLEYACHDCEIKEECDYGNNYKTLAQELLVRLNIKWGEK